MDFGNTRIRQKAMDTHAFASLAHIRILLIPVGTVLQSTFEKYASDIRTFDSIRLGDIPADYKEDKGESLTFPDFLGQH